MWKIISIFVFFVIIFLLAYFLIPFVRYILIPFTGGTRAPESLLAEASGTNFQQHSSAVFANEKNIVSTISEVPAEGGWINSKRLDLKQLSKENKFVLIDFWTYSCINCIRATPYTQELWDRYKNYGLVVIGVHSPEFDFERDPKNIYEAVKAAGITYPVLTDADKKVWNKFGNHFWPGKYLINNKGVIIYTKFGEGDYAKEDKIIYENLKKAGYNPPDYGMPTQFLEPVNKQVTPELYAGTKFIRTPYGNNEQPVNGQIIEFHLTKNREPDRIYLQGAWSAADDYVESVASKREQEKISHEIILNYIANAVYVVFDTAQNPLEVEVLIDGAPVLEKFQGKDITIDERGRTVLVVKEPRMYYPIAETAPYGRHTITFKTPAGLRFYSFTFGAY